MEQSIIQSTGGKQTYTSEMKKKRHNLGTESSLSASDESGDKREITVYSIKFKKSSRSIKITLKNPSSKFFPLLNLHFPRVYSPEDQLSSRLEDSKSDTK